MRSLCLEELAQHLMAVSPPITRWVNPDWARNQTLLEWVKNVSTVRSRTAAPILFVHGAEDTIAAQTQANQGVGALCAVGDVVDYRTYPGADHNTVVAIADHDIMAWLELRLKGYPARQTCQSVAGYGDGPAEVGAWMHEGGW
ncbi:hypothetical protein GCM10012279_48550 [Micromonospora yangpuensis]|nr:hypothetical protein GCM10012279_48550 [Micromonospora yangpuensis]